MRRKSKDDGGIISTRLLRVLSTICAVNQRFDETESVEDLVCRGRLASALTEDKLEEIKEIVTTSPNLLVREDSAQAGISIGSYHTPTIKLHFKPYHPTLIVTLNEDDFDWRNKFYEIVARKIRKRSSFDRSYFLE